MTACNCLVLRLHPWELAPRTTPDGSIRHDPECSSVQERRVCPDCRGTALSPYPGDGGSCPHCFGGYLP